MSKPVIFSKSGYPRFVNRNIYFITCKLVLKRVIQYFHSNELIIFISISIIAQNAKNKNKKQNTMYTKCLFLTHIIMYIFINWLTEMLTLYVPIKLKDSETVYMNLRIIVSCSEEIGNLFPVIFN